MPIADLPSRLPSNAAHAYILRGVRTVKDFEYEKTLADINRKIAGLETVLLYTLPEYGSISSSIVRELISLGRDVTDCFRRATLLRFRQQYN